jgi:ADP-ribose pyrophosphatase YjhB (NUDIX family)
LFGRVFFTRTGIHVARKTLYNWSMNPRPELAVSAAIFRNDTVLLIRRALPPAQGLWTLPGGRVELGERLTDAVHREVMEETGLTVRVGGLAGYREIILDQDVAGRGRHFVILPFVAEWLAGEVGHNEEFREFRWLPVEASATLSTTEGLTEILRHAATMRVRRDL